MPLLSTYKTGTKFVLRGEKLCYRDEKFRSGQNCFYRDKNGVPDSKHARTSVTVQPHGTNQARKTINHASKRANKQANQQQQLVLSFGFCFVLVVLVLIVELFKKKKVAGLQPL